MRPRRGGRAGPGAAAASLQRSYYAAEAAGYDARHVENDEEQEHAVALAVMAGLSAYHGFRSVLDVGAGTGRVIRFLRSSGTPFDRLVGIEPVAEMREIGHAAGVPAVDLIEGDALHLAFDVDEFDLVCAFGVLHHVADPSSVIHEMFRVAKRAVFLSDVNNFGAGPPPVRLAKQALHSLHLWPTVQRVVTRGKGYKYSEGDGIYYSYSLYDSIPVIQQYCAHPNLITTKGFGRNPYRACSHVAVLAVKDKG